MKSLLYILLFVIMSLNVFGFSACNLDENCYLYHTVVENETTSVQIQLTNEWGSMIINDTMSVYSDNIYQYVYAFGVIGEYNYTALVYNDTELLSANYEVVTISESTSSNTYFIWGIILMILFILVSLISSNFVLNVLGFVSCIGLFGIGLTFIASSLMTGLIICIGSILMGVYIGFKE